MMHVPWWFPFGRAEAIAPGDLLARISSPASPQLIDVREPFEYAESHVEGARNVPIHDLPGKLASLGLERERPVVAICLSGHRSIPAYRLLKRAGYTQVAQLDGGMLAWWRANLPTVKHGSDGDSRG